ncbi:MAG: hypothetical protein CMN31_16495 [Sandaracinus sp.]|nr:hypothetical protein [Sandaracinus sp.]MBJ72911.1 hypothetical protein [Sandaracinus sp.]
MGEQESGEVGAPLSGELARRDRVSCLRGGDEMDEDDKKVIVIGGIIGIALLLTCVGIIAFGFLAGASSFGS